MKIIKLIAIGIVLFVTSATQAQVSVSINLGTPPQWGPSGYSQARYYYLPDVETYYDIQASRFIYLDGNIWVHRTYLPSRYRDYDLYNGYKVVMTNYRGTRPYSNFRDHRRSYQKGYRGQAQRTIGQRPQNRNAQDVKHYESRTPQKVDQGNSRNSGRGNNNDKNQNQSRGNDNKGKKQDKGGDRGRNK